MISGYLAARANENTLQTVLEDMLDDPGVYWLVPGGEGIILVQSRGFASSDTITKVNGVVVPPPSKTFEMLFWSNDARIPVAVQSYTNILAGSDYDAVLATEAAADREIVFRQAEWTKGGEFVFDMIFYEF